MRVTRSVVSVTVNVTVSGTVSVMVNITAPSVSSEGPLGAETIAWLPIFAVRLTILPGTAKWFASVRLTRTIAGVVPSAAGRSAPPAAEVAGSTGPI